MTLEIDSSGAYTGETAKKLIRAMQLSSLLHTLGFGKGEKIGCRTWAYWHGTFAGDEAVCETFLNQNEAKKISRLLTESLIVKKQDIHFECDSSVDDTGELRLQIDIDKIDPVCLANALIKKLEDDVSINYADAIANKRHAPRKKPAPAAP